VEGKKKRRGERRICDGSLQGVAGRVSSVFLQRVSSVFLQSIVVRKASDLRHGPFQGEAGVFPASFYIVYLACFYR
jgi:hypothetical protein